MLIPTDDVAGALRRLGANFARAGYATTVEVTPRPRVIARRGTCTVAFKLLDAHATNQASMAQLLAPYGRVAYARNGSWQARLPRVGPLLEYYAKRELARQGVATARNPVWMAAIGSGCAVPPDTRLSDVPVRLVPGGPTPR
jgi:hypothetical protein